jgi:hypothetical protein
MAVKSKQVVIRIPEPLRRTLEATASEQHRTLSNLAFSVLTDWSEGRLVPASSARQPEAAAA